MTTREDRQISELERHLRRACRLVDPPQDLSRKVMAAIDAAGSTAADRQRRPLDRSRPSIGRPWFERLRVGHPWVSAVATAGLIVAIAAGGTLWQSHAKQQVTRAREAHAQAVEALRISSEALDAALRATIDTTRPG